MTMDYGCHDYLDTQYITIHNVSVLWRPNDIPCTMYDVERTV